MSLKFDEASIDRGVRSRRGNFCPPMATHQPPFVSAYVTHRSQVFIGVRSTFQPVRVRACGGALRNPNQPRFIGRQPEARVYTEPPKGEWWQRRVSLSRPPIDKIPSSRPPSHPFPSRANHMHFERSKRFQISIEILGWHLTVRVVESLASIHLSLSLIRVENTYHRSRHFPVFLNEWNLNGMGRRNACQLPFISGQLEFIRCNVDDSFRSYRIL